MLSIIIPVYNRERLIIETLESIRDQTRGDWECLIVDDHSTDATLDVVRSFCEKEGRFRLLSRPAEAPKGPSACRNAGFRHAAGEFVYFLDSDDLIGRDFIASFLPRLEADPELDYLSLRIVRFDGRPDRVVRVSKPKSPDLTIPEAMAAMQIAQSTQCFIWRKSLLDRQSVLWREDLSFGEDKEFYFRLVHEARKGLSVDDPVLVFYRRNRGGICFHRRYDPQILADSCKFYRSMAEACLKRAGSERTQRYLTRYLQKGMRLALRFGDRHYADEFYRLAAPLAAFPKDRKRMDRMRRHPLPYLIYYRSLFLLTALGSKSLFGAAGRRGTDPKNNHGESR